MPSVAHLVPLLLFSRQNGTGQLQDPVPGTATAVLGHSQTNTGGPFVPLMNMTLGDPPQEITAIFDTGSSDLIVPDPRGGFCKKPNSNCEPPTQGGNGAFDQKKSEDVTDANAVLETSFANGETDSGNFIKAPAGVGAAALEDFQFGLIKQGRPGPESPQASLRPVLGVGPMSAETESTKPYPNLPAHMQQTGATKSRVVSVYTNDFRGNDGSVTYGGIDKAKFTGELKEAPLVAAPPFPGPEGDDRQQGNKKNGDSGNGSGKGNGKGNGNGNGNGNSKQSKGPSRGNGGGAVATADNKWRVWGIRKLRKRSVYKRQQRDNRDANDGGDGQKNGNGKTIPVEFFVEMSSVSFNPAKGGKQERDKDKQRGRENDDNDNSGGGNGRSRGKRDSRDQDSGSKENNNRNRDDRSGEKKQKGNNNNNNKNNKNNDNNNNNKNNDNNNNKNNKNNDKDEAKGNREGAVNLMPSGDKGPALIDTGNPESQLPEEAVRKLADQFGSEFVEEDGSIAAFDCSRAQGTMRFGFNQDKAVVEVPIEMMMIPKSITKSEGCDLALTAGDTVSLGSPFLQAAYVVFDDENKRIMFAQAVMNTTRSDIEAVGPDWKGTASGTG